MFLASSTVKRKVSGLLTVGALSCEAGRVTKSNLDGWKGYKSRRGYSRDAPELDQTGEASLFRLELPHVDLGTVFLKPHFIH
jgi:hypothetical protein